MGKDEEWMPPPKKSLNIVIVKGPFFLIYFKSILELPGIPSESLTHVII